jgi:SNF2 family DNA or RNA helicase
LATQTNIHIINRDAVGWLEKQLRGRQSTPWQAIVVDESTSFKNWSASRSKALRKIVDRIPYRTILTGTPAPRNLADLFPQIWLLDQGKALGENITRFREQYCMQLGEKQWNNFAVKDGMHDRIHDAINHLVLRLDAKDHLSIPEVTFHDIAVEMPAAAKMQYDVLEKEMFLALQDGQRGIVNAGAKYSACKQVANGGIYDDQHRVHHLHDAKTEACVDLIGELQGKPLLIAYQFEHDVQRLERSIKGLHVIRGGTKESTIQDIVDRWNNNTLDPPYLAVQPQALSYGVNMQYGDCRDVFWYGPTDNLDIYLQLNARIHRQGVGSCVRIHRAYSVDTIDEVVWSRTDNKEDVQSKLLDVLREYAKQKRS